MNEPTRNLSFKDYETLWYKQIRRAEKLKDEINEIQILDNLRLVVLKLISHYISILNLKDEIILLRKRINTVNEQITLEQLRTVQNVLPMEVQSKSDGALNYLTTLLNNNFFADPKLFKIKSLNELKFALIRRALVKDHQFILLLSEEIQNRISTRLSKTSLWISVGALIAVLLFSILDWQGDKSWQTEQLNALQNIKYNTEAIKHRFETEN